MYCSSSVYTAVKTARMRPLARWRTGTVLGFLAVLGLTGCVTYPSFPDAHVYKPSLISGELAFGETIAPAPAVDLLKMSADMHKFVELAGIYETNLKYTRFRRLMGGLIKGGYFSNHYREDGTYSAEQTFASAQGNCLGYTNMFVALARQAGLNARYQLIEEQPRWDIDQGHLVRNNHVNVVIDNVGLAGRYSSEVVVDFNLVRADSEIARPKVVSDAFAEALYYINLGVDALSMGQHREAFAQFKRAEMTDPDNKFVWNNLGVLYSRLGKSDVAQRAYEVALSIDSSDKSALAGMVVTLQAQGLYEASAVYEQRVALYQQKNPYFHFAVASQAFAAEKFDEALSAIEAAIDLRGNDARFFALRAATAEELGMERLKRRSESLADKYTRLRGDEVLRPNAGWYGRLEVNGT